MIMKTILFTIICIVPLLWAGDPTVTFKPFSISLPGRHKASGIILSVFAMAVHDIGGYVRGYRHGFDDGIRECIEAIRGNGKNRAHGYNRFLLPASGNALSTAF